MLVRSPWQMSPPAITEVVAAVRLARIADGVARPAPAPPRRWRCGREFSHALLAAVARKSDAQLALALDRLIRSGLLFRQSVPPQATYLFKHPLVPDAEGYRVAMHTRCFQCAGLSR